MTTSVQQHRNAIVTKERTSASILKAIGCTWAALVDDALQPKIKQTKNDCQVQLRVLVHVLVLVVSIGELDSMSVGMRTPRCDYGGDSIINEDE